MIYFSGGISSGILTYRIEEETDDIDDDDAEKEDFHSAADLATSDQQRLTKGNSNSITISNNSSGSNNKRPAGSDSVAINLPAHLVAASTTASTTPGAAGSAAASPNKFNSTAAQQPSTSTGSPGSRDYVGLSQQSPKKEEQPLSFGPARPSFFRQFYNLPKKNSNNSSGSSSLMKQRDVEAELEDDFDFGPVPSGGGGGNGSSSVGTDGNSFRLTPRKTPIDKTTTDEELRPLSNGYVLQNS